jgi:hypothetical protein
VALIGVIGPVCWLVRASEPDQVRSHHAISTGYEGRDHLSVEVAPRRLPVHEQDSLFGIYRTLVQIVDPKRSRIGIVRVTRDFDIVGSEVEPGETVEAFIGSAENLHCQLRSGSVV